MEVAQCVCAALPWTPWPQQRRVRDGRAPGTRHPRAAQRCVCNGPPHSGVYAMLGDGHCATGVCVGVCMQCWVMVTVQQACVWGCVCNAG
jgi:hypothetical protein